MERRLVGRWMWVFSVCLRRGGLGVGFICLWAFFLRCEGWCFVRRFVFTCVFAVEGALGGC